jgi:hypothetical protein
MVALFVASPLFVITISSTILAAQNNNNPASQNGTRAVIYVMPNAFATPGSADTVQGVADSGRAGREPQVAKIYHELQTRKECQGFVENMNKDKADYFLLLQHGGGKGNRWAVSDKQGNVLASGESLRMGNSVKDACLAIAKDRQEHLTPR